MVQTKPKPLTLSEFLQLPETKPASEFINGNIIQKPMPKGRHSRLQAQLCATINQVTESAKIAYAFPELRCSFGDRSIVPDVAIFSWKNIPFTDRGEIPDNFNIAPNWVIEILSPDQRPNKVLGNLLYCLDHGTKLGWFIDPDDFSILVVRPQIQPILCEGITSLPMLEDIPLQLTVEQIFNWLKMN